jgi:hypothetical protein
MIRLKEHLSWSQYSLWKTSKRQYYKKYSLGEESKPNKFFNKGKELGSYLQLLNENKDNVNPKTLAESISSDPMLFIVGQIVPTLDVMEDKLETEISGVKTLSFVDSVNIENTEFLEYKTGKVDPKGNDPWNQQKVNEHNQLLFYALSYYIKSGRESVPKAMLVWIETIEEDVEDELGNFSHTILKYTGRVDMFLREFLVAELVDFEKDLLKTVKEIEEYEYNELEVAENVVERYIELKKMMDNCKKEMDAIKSEVLVEMNLDEVKYAASSKGRFSITDRKSWSYSSDLKNTMDDSKKFFTKQQKMEQQDGSAKFTISSSLGFRES